MNEQNVLKSADRNTRMIMADMLREAEHRLAAEEQSLGGRFSKATTIQDGVVFAIELNEHHGKVREFWTMSGGRVSRMDAARNMKRLMANDIRRRAK